MKNLLLLASLLACTASVLAQDLGVSVPIGQPGFYGRIDIGNRPPPPVLYAQPLIIERRVQYAEEPLYLRVPPGHAKNWRKHCRRYNACGRPVHFVRDSWYLNDYAPRYRAEQQHHGARHEDGRRGDRDDEHGKQKHKHDQHQHGKHDQHGGHGKGHGKD